MKIDLLGGDYQPRSALASVQRRLNLYTEALASDAGEPGKVIHYPTPGLRLLGQTPNGKPIRGLYRASNGDLYATAGFDIYFIDRSFTFKLVGTIKTTKELNPIKMADNGVSLIYCDGTAVNGDAINMKSRSGLSPLYDPSASDSLTDSSTGWLGSTFVDFTDGYLVANSIGTPAWYISNSEDTIFDPLQFATKSAYPDVLVAAIVQHRVVWLIGEVSTEVWYNSGGGSTLGNTFPFELMPGVAHDWGCVAPYSIAKAETSIFWLAQHQNGEIIVLRGNGYNIKRISTHAIEHIFRKYVVDDCIAYCYMIEGHSFYVLNFPSSDATWAYDLSTGLWHQLAWIDDNGVEHRHRATMHAFAYETNVVNDWQNGNLYALDLGVTQDNGRSIKRVVGFPRLIEGTGDHRLVFQSFIAEVSTGDTYDPTDNTTMMLSWSEDKGRTFGNAMPQSSGGIGQFNKLVKWQRLGLSRNRVFQLEWTTDANVALEGAFVNVIEAGS